MAGLVDEYGKERNFVHLDEFKKELVEVRTGHFGLTIFRVSSLRRMKKPWFHAKPDPTGGWGEGRIDEDISFWHQFAASGLKAFAASNVRIGHLQLMSTFPGPLDENWNPQNLYMGDIEAGRMPDYIVPKTEFKKE
jgi:hypothetical protein